MATACAPAQRPAAKRTERDWNEKLCAAELEVYLMALDQRDVGIQALSYAWRRVHERCRYQNARIDGEMLWLFWHDILSFIERSDELIENVSRGDTRNVLEEALA